MKGLVGMAFPTVSAIISNNVDETEQGRVKGALFSVRYLSSGFGPTLFRAAYRLVGGEASVFGQGSMFLFSACMFLSALICSWFLPPEANSKREALPLSVVDWESLTPLGSD
ncbi:hypothetical protein ACA910_021455 [Epithemia clementina (nom. ined.)]